MSTKSTIVIVIGLLIAIVCLVMAFVKVRSDRKHIETLNNRQQMLYRMSAVEQQPIRERVASKPHHRAMKVRIVETKVTFPSQTAAAKWLGCSQPEISNAIKNNTQVHGYTIERVN